MLPRYMEACLRLPLSSVRLLERIYQLPRKGSLFFRLEEAKVSQADAVLSLLYNDDYDGVAVLIGKPVTICPACLSRRFESYISHIKTDDKAIIRAVKPNPRQATTISAERAFPAFMRYNQLKEGMTVAQALKKGVRRRDLREWSAEGSVVIQQG